MTMLPQNTRHHCVACNNYCKVTFVDLALAC